MLSINRFDLTYPASSLFVFFYLQCKLKKMLDKDRSGILIGIMDWQLQKILWVMYNGGQAKKVHHGSHYLWFLQQISNFPFFRTQKNHFQHYKSWSGHDSSIEFFFQIFPNYQGMCQCAAKPKILLGSGPFWHICVRNPCAHPKKTTFTT